MPSLSPPLPALSPSHDSISERDFEIIDWAIESLAFRLDSVARELDRFANEAGVDGGRLEWCDTLIAGVLVIEAQFEDLLESGLPAGFEDWSDLAETALHHSDWLLQRADEALEYFEDHRLGLRLSALAGLCFDIARWVPMGLSRTESRPFSSPRPRPVDGITKRRTQALATP